MNKPSGLRRHYSLTGLLLVTLLPTMGAGCQYFEPFGSYIGRVRDNITGHSPRNAAVQMEDPYFPDERRMGINALSDRPFGREAPYTTRYEQIAQTDNDWLVRATAIRALNRSRWRQATPTFVRALSDANEHVRLEAAKALANMPDETAAGPLLKLVNDPDEPRDVRIASADALRHYPTIEVARTLVSQLSGREFGLAWQSRKSLKVLTHEDYYYDESAWLNFITGPGKPLG